jgi:hypothetical protein
MEKNRKKGGDCAKVGQRWQNRIRGNLTETEKYREEKGEYYELAGLL